MSQKSINSLNQHQSPIKLQPEEVPSKISTSKRLVSTSLMFSYFGDSHCYLNRKYSENNAIDFLHSNNFVRKDSLCLNNDETKDNEEEDMVNSEENESEDEENEYGQLNANGVYNQQYINQQPQDSNNKLPLFRFNLNQQFNLMTLNQIQQQQRPRFNSGNFTMAPNNFNFQSPYQVENYEKKGWICSQCNNFNYDTRNKCNRCHAARTSKKNKKNNVNNNNVNTNNRQFSERVGDWICFNCKNLNFSFRTICNRCQLSKEESEDMLVKYQMNNKDDINN